MKILHTIQLTKTTGKKVIAEASDVFSYIDSDFRNWKTDKKGVKTADMNLSVCELTEDMTFAQMFTKPEDMSLSQEQIIQFCTEHKDKLKQDWYTFFLFKVDSEFFVAGVDVYSDGHLGVRVGQFSRDYVWGAERRRRVVLPQLTLELSAPDTLNLSLSDTLQKAIEVCKENGYQVSKIL